MKLERERAEIEKERDRERKRERGKWLEGKGVGRLEYVWIGWRGKERAKCW